MSLKFPPIYLLKTHFKKDPEELHRLEKEIGVVWKPTEAKVFIGKVGSKPRAAHELRVLGLHTEEIVRDPRKEELGSQESFSLTTSRKRRKLHTGNIDGKDVESLGSSTESGSENLTDYEDKKLGHSTKQVHLAPKSNRSLDQTHGSLANKPTTVDDSSIIKVLKLDWYLDSLKANTVLPLDKPYLVYEGKAAPKPPSTPERKERDSPSSVSILARAKADSPAAVTFPSLSKHHRSPENQSRKHSQLFHEDTAEQEATQNRPPIPEYMKTKYCCQRPTPLYSPNDEFLAQLKVIRRARELESAEVIGHAFADKAYSNAIATIASYPYTITSPSEVMSLPNCSGKIAGLWEEWKNTGSVREVESIKNDERMKSLDLFEGIYHVGGATAREFYEQKGWRDLDDVVEKGWSLLTKTQQLGLKYYDDFQQRIPRSEVKRTGEVVLSCANSIHTGFHMAITGGYRRGKEDSGDMDFVLSHPNEEYTEYFLTPLLDKLFDEGWIINTLLVSERNSERGQETLAWQGGQKKAGKRSGFDTLDHAFVVWQDPNFTASSGPAKNPNTYRRVDIIIAPWHTAGCAVLGWTGGTMFERDLRRYCRKEKGWKFDSSGVRNISDGAWIDLESREEGRAEWDEQLEGEESEALVIKEKWVFLGLDLEYRPPGERCTH